MVRWVVGSILHGGPIELFLIPVSAPKTGGARGSSWCDRSSDPSFMVDPLSYFSFQPVLPRLVGVRCSSVVRAFAHGATGRRIDPSWWTH